MRKIRFLIVYGPTEEPLDPVRYLTNRSTGTMGRALVAAAKKKRHAVDFVECPTDARTARDLLGVLKTRVKKADVLIMAAAVCDKRPATYSGQKIKKGKLGTIRLVENPDILATLAKAKNKKQIFVGFGLESKKILEYGFAKLHKKGLELIVLQGVTKNSDPFGDKKVETIFLEKCGCFAVNPPSSKEKIAERLIEKIETIFYNDRLACD